MLSLASVAISHDGGILGQFEATLTPRDDRVPDPGVMRWWKSQPEAYAACTKDPLPAQEVMSRYADWVESLPRPRTFAAHPLMFDGPWIDEYLRQFGNSRALLAPHVKRPIFDCSGLDIPSFVSGVCGWDIPRQVMGKYPLDWTVGLQHTHRAIDDATRYAHILLSALRIAAKRQK